jgi:hypothetical protein
MSAEIKGILKSDGIELLGSGLDKVTRIHFRQHGVWGDDASAPSPGETEPELVTNPSYSQNPTRIFLSGQDLQTFWDNEGMFDWSTWYKLALYYNDAQNAEQVYIPDGFVSVFDDGSVGGASTIGGIEIVTYPDGGSGPVGPDGATGSVTNGFLEVWGNQWIKLVPATANGFGNMPQVDIYTVTDQQNPAVTSIVYVLLPDGSILIYLGAILSAIGEALSSPGYPFDPHGQFTFTVTPENGTGTPVPNPSIGIGPILGNGNNAHLSPVVRELGVLGQPGITVWTIQAMTTDVGFIEGVHLDNATSIEFFDPDSVPALNITGVAFTVETALDGYPTRLQFNFADAYAIDPSAWDTHWIGRGATFYVRVINPYGRYDTYAVTQYSPSGGG